MPCFCWFVFLSGEHLRYRKSCGISVILVLFVCFVLFWCVLAASPDAGLESWCGWFNYVPVFLSVPAVAYLLVACVLFSLSRGLDARMYIAYPKSTSHVTAYLGSILPATDYFASRRPWESSRSRMRAALARHSKRQHNDRIQHCHRCLYALQILPCTSGPKLPHECTMHREVTRQLGSRMQRNRKPLLRHLLRHQDASRAAETNQS